MTTRAQLQSKSIDELRKIAEAAGVESDGLQKSKLISVLMNADEVETKEAKPTETVDLPKATPRQDKSDTDARSGDGQKGQNKGSQQKGDNNQGGQRSRKRSRRRDDDDTQDGDLEVREGLLDILPEGYGFPRVTGYTSGEKDVYVSANQVRKFRLRKGDIVSGPIRPPRSKEKFPAVVRIEKVRGSIPLSSTSFDKGLAKNANPLFRSRPLLNLDRHIALHGCPVHMASINLGVVRLCKVHGAAIIPKHHIARCPFVTIYKRIRRTMGIKLSEKFGTATGIHIHHIFKYLTTKVNRLATGLRMSAYYRMPVSWHSVALFII